MAVNLHSPKPEELLPVPGVEIGVAEAGIKKPGRRDLTVFRLAEGSRVAGVFTSNRFCAAPVHVCREHLARYPIRALVINTGNANAGTGEPGMANARRTCDELAGLLGCRPEQILPFSTGVILEPLPMDRLLAGLPQAVANLKPDNWYNAAHGIMTTDTVPKARSMQISLGGKTVTITGISKGAGMIRPNMATMLGYVATDAAIGQAELESLVKHAVDHSFNRITVDGDTSTNDSFIMIATGRAGNAEITDLDSTDYQALRDALTALSAWLAQAIIRDGEGATKFITVQVQGGGNEEECLKVAYAVAHSPLIKTAFFASDPNLGRILAAIGYAGIADLDVNGVKAWLDDVLVAESGGRSPSYNEQDGLRVMKQEEITIRIDLGRGSAETRVWTCDLSYDYVKINAEYRT